MPVEGAALGCCQASLLVLQQGQYTMYSTRAARVLVKGAAARCCCRVQLFEWRVRSGAGLLVPPASQPQPESSSSSPSPASPDNTASPSHQTSSSNCLNYAASHAASQPPLTSASQPASHPEPASLGIRLRARGEDLQLMSWRYVKVAQDHRIWPTLVNLLVRSIKTAEATAIPNNPKRNVHSRDFRGYNSGVWFGGMIRPTRTSCLY